MSVQKRLHGLAVSSRPAVAGGGEGYFQVGQVDSGAEHSNGLERFQGGARIDNRVGAANGEQFGAGGVGDTDDAVVQ
ncbi:MAG: Uncharacterised protein [Cellulomonadaceae bacterium TMED98]|nr:MAG: Uncharacterised protein [Cellulomonadaceae bacterium TMED98]